MKEDKLVIVNARIYGTFLGITDQGHMTFFVFLEWSFSSQGLGGYVIDKYLKDSKEREGWKLAIPAIRKILETVGVEKWEDLKGKLVRIKVAELGSSRPPVIGNILEDKWFDLKEFVEAHKD